MSATPRTERARKRRQSKNRRPDVQATRFWLETLEDRTVPAQALAVGPDLGFVGPSPNSSAQLGQSLYFLAHQGSAAPGASDIWKVQGSTTAQAVNVPALAGQAVSEIVNANGTLYVTAYALPANPLSIPPTTPAETNVWKLDSSAPGGAVRLTDFDASGATSMQVVGNRVFFGHTSFSATPGNFTSELWTSDGSLAGTQSIASFSGDGHPDLVSAVAAGNDLYFQVYSLQSPTPAALWVTDGSANGTHAVTVAGGGAVPTVAGFGLQAAGNAVFFSSAKSDGTQSQLWTAVDGQASLLRTFSPTNGSAFAPTIGAMTSANGKLYFAVNGNKGGEIWTNDGTANGTLPLYQPATGSMNNSIADVAVANGVVYFGANLGGSLLKLDGQGAPTALPLPSGVTGVFPSLNVVENHLYFVADNGVHGAELWSTDGTANGTVRRTDINPGSGSSYPMGPLLAGGAKYVTASDGIPTAPGMYAPTRLWKLAEVNAPAGAAATTTLTSSANSVITGGSVSLTATIIANVPGNPSPTGSVAFRDAMQIYGSAPIVNGVASLTAVISTPGSHSLRAVYLGDTNFDESISSAVALTAGQSGTTVTLTTSDAFADPGQAITLTANVKATLVTTLKPSGFVSFFDGTSFLGSGFLNNGIATYQTTALSTGNHAVTAIYNGDPSFSPGSSAPLTQNIGASLSLGLTTSHSSAALGTPVKLTARLTAANGAALPVGASITFRDGTTTIGTATVGATGDAVFTFSNLAIGAHSITAAYTAGSTVTSNSVSVGIQKNASALTIRSTAQTSRLGQSVTITASLAAPPAGTQLPTGQVIFKDGAVTLGTATVSNGKAVILLSNLTLGSHPITATYSGDANYAGSSANLTQTVTNAAVVTTTKVQVPASSIGGQSVNLTATVTPAVGTAIPTGSITFRDGNTIIGSTLLDSAGKALFITNSLAIGNHLITATYNGAGIFGGSASAPANLSMRLASKSSITSSASTSVFTQGVTLTATIAPATTGAMQPSGNVTFYDGPTALGTVPINNGIAKLTTGPLTVGIHKLTAVYGGNALFASSTSSGVYLNVRAASTTITLQQPAAPASNGTMILTANITVATPATGKPTGRVTFMEGSTTLGSAMLVNGQAKVTIPRLSNGSHYLRAVYQGAGGYAGSSSAIMKANIGATTSTTATAIVLEASAATVGQTTTLKATVSALAPGSTKPTGRVTFKDGATILGSAMLQNGIATFGIKLAAGAHSLLAAYEGSTQFGASTTTPLAYVVKAVATPR